MPGKCRPSLLSKTLYNVVQSNLSRTDKECIVSVFKKHMSADVVEVVRCKDCKFQIKAWHKDGRMKEGGYWIYQCDRNDDPFVCHAVCGYDDEFCCYGERKEDNDRP